MDSCKYICDDQGVPRPKTGITPVRNLRVSDDLWEPSRDKAKAEKLALTAVIVEFLRAFSRMTVDWADYVKACKAEETTPGDDIRRHIQRKVQSWKRRQAND